MKFSVVVPIYKIKNELLIKCVNSIEKQTYQNFELLLVDDGSTSENVKTCYDFVNQNKKINLLRKANGGVSSARNMALQKVTGDYVIFLDADDYLLEDTLESINNIVSNEKYELIIFDHEKIFSTSSRIVNSFPNSRDLSDNIKAIYNTKILGYSTQKAYRRDIIIDKRFDESISLAEDIEFNFRIFPEVTSVYYINRAFYQYNIFDDSSVRKNDPDKIGKYNQTLEKIINGQNSLSVSINHELMYNAYLEVASIFLLLIVSNDILSTKVNLSYNNKKNMIKDLVSNRHYTKVLDNIKNIKLSKSKKVSLYLLKYKQYRALEFAVKIKERLDK